MLQLVITQSQELDTLTLTDATPAYSAATALGGYGGPNPLATELALFAVLGQQLPGSFRFGATSYPLGEGALRFKLPQDGLYLAYVFAVSRVRPLPTAPIGTTFTEQGEIFFRQKGQATPGVLGAALSFEELRGFSPELLFAADLLLPVLSLERAQHAVDKLLLEYARQGSRNRPQRGEDYSAGWLLAQATLESVRSLHQKARYPEAATQLAALSQQLSVRPADVLPLTSQSTDWLQEQTA